MRNKKVETIRVSIRPVIGGLEASFVNNPINGYEGRANIYSWPQALRNQFKTAGIYKVYRTNPGSGCMVTVQVIEEERVIKYKARYILDNTGYNVSFLCDRWLAMHDLPNTPGTYHVWLKVVKVEPRQVKLHKRLASKS